MCDQEEIKKDKFQKIEIRSEEFQEILGSTPHWLLRSGILVILSVIVIILIGSYFFKYPDIITSQVSIVTQNPSVPLKSFSSGKITDLFFSESESVKENDVIAVIENTANYIDVIFIKNIIDTLSDFKFFPNISNINLGEIQQTYSLLSRNLASFKNYNELDYHTNRIKSTEKQILEYKQYLIQLEKQLRILDLEFKLSDKQFKRDEVLYNKDVYSLLEYEKAEQLFLQQKRNYESFKSTLSNTQMKITQLEQQILDLELQRVQEYNNYEVQINESLEGLKSQLSQWEKTYLIKSPINGYVTFNEIWSKNQTVQSGQTIATIVPKEETEIIGKILIPASGVGKIKLGNPVNIKLDNYPYMEFGMIRANINSISLVPIVSENGVFYTAELRLVSGFISNYGKKLHFTQNMTGVAEIITDDLRLLERFLNPIRSLLKKNADY